MLFSESIKTFLVNSTYKDLADLYNHDMEVQILVAQDEGDRLEKGFKGEKTNTFTDGIQTWFSYRIPKNANTVPEDNDKEIKYDLAKHALGIGCTGWDFENKISKFVAFDFDAISGHSDKHANKLTELELQEVQENVKSIPWVQVRYSTSGSGLHLYVFLPNIPTVNHIEHKALARAILSMMSGITHYDFQSKVDALGGILWFWHRKMIGTRGLKLIKNHSELCDIPSTWRDHLSVVSGKKSKSIPFFIPEDVEDTFLELCGQKARIKLDDDHKKLIKYLHDNGHTCMYNQDHHLFIVHTHALKEAHIALKLKGLFDTISAGSEGGDHNAWINPLSKGGWIVRRYTQGIQEKDNWDQDSTGYTKCYLNKVPEFKIIARCYNGLEHPTGGWVFASAKEAQEAANVLGVDLGLPDWSYHKKTKLKINKEGRLIAELDFDSSSDIIKGGLKNYLQEGKTWKKIFDNPTEQSEIESSNFDDVVRHLVSNSNDDVGWAIKTFNHNWESNPVNHVQKALQSLGHTSSDVTQILGSCVMKSWKIVNLPFQNEYPGDRRWNKNAAQLQFIPSSDLDNLNFPSWNILFNHLGKSLDEALLKNDWAAVNGITKGSDYIKLWISSVLQKPEEPTPYLFLCGNENCGKSTLHEALSLLIVNGVKRVDNALTSQGSFNGELENSVICVTEETDLKKNKAALNKIRDWVTSRTITIHKKGLDPFDTANTSHFIQCSNDSNALPIFPGDTRITVIHVSDIPKENQIAKRELFKSLEKEAPDILAELLSIDIPICDERLNIPVIETEAKAKAQDSNKSDLEMFTDECCHYVPGSTIKFSDFYNRFLEFLSPDQVPFWSKIRVGREIPSKFVYGRSPAHANQQFVGNISWVAPENGQHNPECVVKGGKLLVSTI